MKNKFDVEVIKKLANLDNSEDNREYLILNYINSCKPDLPYFKAILAKTHRTLQMDINRMRKLCTDVSNAILFKKYQLKQMNELITKLLKEERITREELQEYVFSTKKAKEKFKEQNEPKEKIVEIFIQPEKSIGCVDVDMTVTPTGVKFNDDTYSIIYGKINDIVFSKGCLDDIIDFLNQLNTKKK
jgi:hypothetical protein